MELFSIGGIDFTGFILSPTYNINEQDEYTEWVDANRITHRDIYRQKVSGSFSMYFKHPDSFSRFISALSSAKAEGGYYPVYLYVNNLLQRKSIEAYLTLSPAIKRKRGEMKDVEKFKVQVKER